MDETIPQVDGLRLVERVDGADGVGRGEVWRARLTGGLAGEDGAALPGDLSGVGECLVRLLRMPVDEALRARAQTLARDLLALDEPGLLPLRSVRRAYDGVALVYGDVPASATGLHLLARRRLLRAGEVVTLGVALCWALAHAHAAGISHGRLCDADVLIAGDGRPVLTGVGVLGILGAPVPPEGDVRGLERMLGSLLDHDSAGAAKVAQSLAAGSPGCAALAALLASAVHAEPIRLDEPLPGGADPEVRPAQRARVWPRIRRPGWARPRIVAVGAAVVLLGALAGWVSAPGPRAASRPADPGKADPGKFAPGAAAPTDWRQVLTKLDRARSAAFERPDALGSSGFALVDAPASAASRYDTAAAESLRAHGVHAAGLQIVLEQVALESATPTRVILRVTDRLPGYELRDGSGRLVSRAAGRGSAEHRIVLAATGHGGAGSWRIASVTDLAAAVSS